MTIWPAAGRSDRKGEALERRTRPEAEARGGVRAGGSPPATTIHYYNRKGEALENFPPAEGRPVGGVQGGQRPPAQHYSIIMIFSFLNGGRCGGAGAPPPNDDSKSG